MTWTQTIILLSAIGLMMWDAFTDWAWGITTTESWQIALLAGRHPMFVFNAGMLAGHFLLGMKIQ